MKLRKWAVPESRLPFVNAEIAKTTFQGEPHLVSSIWGGGSGGRIFFWNPDTGSHAMRMLPEGIPGAYMLKPGPDGKLYLGCGNSDLVRYNPETDEFEDLVRENYGSITWGGCLTDRYAVWSFSPGRVGVYDFIEDRFIKVFDPADTEEPVAQYGHRVVVTPEGNALVGMDSPQGRFIFVDLESMTTKSVTPDALQGKGGTSDLTFFDEHTVAAFIGGLHLFSYPDFALIDVIPNPDGVSSLGARACFVGDDYYAMESGSGSSLYRLDRAGKRWDLVTESLCDNEVTGVIHPWNDHTVCAVSLPGMTYRYDLRTGEKDTLDLEATGYMAVHAFCPVPQKDLILGAPFINQRFWSIDMKTGEGRDLGRGAPGGGQINQIVWDEATDRALLTSYTTTSVTSYDPADTAAWPENPVLIGSARHEGQMRPKEAVHDGRHVWMVTSPEYGTHGGALCRIDPQTKEFLVWRDIVENQTIMSLVVDTDRRRVICSSEIFADCNSAPPITTTAEMVAFDMDSLSVTARQILAEDVSSLRVRALLPSGEALAETREGDLWAWNADDGVMTPMGKRPGPFYIAQDAERRMWVAVGGDGVGRFVIENGAIRYEKLIDINATHIAVAEGVLYFAADPEICSVPLAELPAGTRL